jgi:glutamine amidotransferase
MIGIINYGLGNLHSIDNIIRNIGGECSIITKPSELNQFDKLILPGVGAFDHGMKGLKNGNWIEPLNELVLEKNIPVLGICLGMQLMCNGSEEGQLAGLGWIDADVKRFSFPEDSSLKIPHMGWNTLAVQKTSPLFDNSEKEQRFYFVHSYHVVCRNKDVVLATANYGYDIDAAFYDNNIIGVQFHPEKSHRFGKMFFEKFKA